MCSVDEQSLFFLHHLLIEGCCPVRQLPFLVLEIAIAQEDCNDPILHSRNGRAFHRDEFAGRRDPKEDARCDQYFDQCIHLDLQNVICKYKGLQANSMLEDWQK